MPAKDSTCKQPIGDSLADHQAAVRLPRYRSTLHRPGPVTYAEMSLATFDDFQCQGFCPDLSEECTAILPNPRGAVLQVVAVAHRKFHASLRGL